MSNGLKLEAEGNLIAAFGADNGGPMLLKADMETGKSYILTGLYDGKPYNSLNDVTIDEQGRIHFSDPRYLGHEPIFQSGHAVYRLDPDGTVERLVTDAGKANGVLVSPDQNTLHVVSNDDGAFDFQWLKQGEETLKGQHQLSAYDLAADAPLGDATVRLVVALTCAEPPGEATHWTGRAMAKTAAISLRSVQRIWAAHQLQPHRIRTLKRSRDPDFAAKLEAIVGLYVDPPRHAVVLSVDEKSQIQALDRTQPGLLMKRGRAGTMTHDYKRHGTTTLFAVLNVLEGTVIGQCMARHRHQEFIRFLNAVERAVPAGRVIHAILDNYGNHKQPKVMAWLARHPRWTFHFTPTSGSWLNAVETFFSALTRRRLKRGTFHSIVDLQAAINRYIAEHNDDPKPFTWTKPTDQILAKVNRLNASLH